MQKKIVPQCKNIPPYVYWEDVFTEEDIFELQKLASRAENFANVGGPDGQPVFDKQIRSAKVFWLHNSSEMDKFYERLGYVIENLNREFFGFDLEGFGEPIQLTNYNSSYAGKYDWHCDFNSTISRKLSLVLQLSKPSEYEGGVLEIIGHDGTILQIDKKQNYLVAFPSWALHRVTPVTAGHRQSLVSWVSGQPFR
jgi:PKHD-type hydroxylase